MKPIEDLMKDARNLVEQSEKLLEVIKILKEYPEMEKYTMTVHYTEQKLSISVRSMEQLHELRSDLRKIFPNWRDGLAWSGVSSIGDEAYSIYEHPELPIAITWVREIQDLLSGGCRLEERSYKTLVCTPEKGETNDGEDT